MKPWQWRGTGPLGALTPMGGGNTSGSHRNNHWIKLLLIYHSSAASLNVLYSDLIPKVIHSQKYHVYMYISLGFWNFGCLDSCWLDEVPLETQLFVLSTQWNSSILTMQWKCIQTITLLVNELVIVLHSIIHPDLQNLNLIPRFLSVAAHKKTWCTNKKLEIPNVLLHYILEATTCVKTSLMN